MKTSNAGMYFHLPSTPVNPVPISARLGVMSLATSGERETIHPEGDGAAGGVRVHTSAVPFHRTKTRRMGSKSIPKFSRSAKGNTPEASKGTNIWFKLLELGTLVSQYV